MSELWRANIATAVSMVVYYVLAWRDHPLTVLAAVPLVLNHWRLGVALYHAYYPRE